MTIQQTIGTTGRCQQTAAMQTILPTSNYMQTNDCSVDTIDIPAEWLQQSAAMQNNLRTSDSAD